MEYPKIANLLDNEVPPNVSNQSSKFKTRTWVEINYDSRGTYTGNSIKFKTTTLRSNLCDYAEIYIYIYIYLYLNLKPQKFEMYVD